MSRIIRRALALYSFFFLLLLSLTAKGETVIAGSLQSLPLVVPSGAISTSLILDFPSLQHQLDLTASFLAPKHPDWVQPSELRTSGEPRQVLSSHLNPFSTLKVTQHVTTAFDFLVTPRVLPSFSKADTAQLASSPEVTLSSPASNTTASVLSPRSHESLPLSKFLSLIDFRWPVAPTRNSSEALKRYALVASLFATLVFSTLPIVAHCDPTFQNKAAVACSTLKHRIDGLLGHYHAIFTRAEAQLTNFSKSIDRVGRSIIRTFRFLGLLDRDIVTIGLSASDDSLPPWPDFGEPDAEWPPSRRRARSNSYDSPYMDTPFINLPWADHHRAKTPSMYSFRTSSPSPEEETLSSPPPPLPPLPPSPSPPTPPPMPPSPSLDPDAYFDSFPHQYPRTRPTELHPHVWGIDPMLPIEWWFEKDPADEIKPDPWNLPPLYVDEEEEELARLSKGFENDRLFISFEANPKLLKQYLSDPQGFRDRLPPPKKEDTSWHYRSWDPNSTAFRVSKEGRRTRKRSEVASGERSTKKSEAANKQEERPEGESSTPALTPPTSDAGGLEGNQQNEAAESTTETDSSPHPGCTLPKPERLAEVPVSKGIQRIAERSEVDTNDLATEKKSGEANKRLKGESSVPTPTPPTSDAVASKGDDQKATSESMRGAGSQLHGVSTIKRISRKIVGTMKGRRFGFILPPKNKTRSNAGP